MPRKTKKAKSVSLRDQVLQQLEAAEAPMTSAQITEALGLRKGARVRAHLRQLAEEGRIKRLGPQNRASWAVSDGSDAADAADEAPPPTDLTVQLVDHMAAEIKPWKARDLAKALGVDHLDVRSELVELEQLGVVYRTGRTRGTRWHVG